MRRMKFRTVLLVGACLMSSIAAMSQTSEQRAGHGIGALDAAITVNPVMSQSQSGTRFWMAGGSAQIHDRLYKGLGVVGDIAAAHTGNIDFSNVGLTLVTTTFGPRYTLQVPKQKAEIYVQVLAGFARGMDSTFPSFVTSNSTASSYAVNLGGGVNVPINKRFSYRVVEASWLRTALPNGSTDVQNALRLGTGLIVHF